MEKITHNITVTLLCPGPVFSNFLAESFTDKPGEVGICITHIDTE
jgi:dehydrogenase/reductase SDR family protein 7